MRHANGTSVTFCAKQLRSRLYAAMFIDQPTDVLVLRSVAATGTEPCNNFTLQTPLIMG